jgi:proteasome lid subunit RPN8/RPN11
MTRRSKSTGGQPTLFVDSEVVRQIRQHARSCSKTEVCGVLIGQDREGVVEVEASITGLNAEEAGAHVTFTQDTWEHIYKVKDKEFPDHRIVGWYHSHPGFGVFLSDHDTFIHKNFFSSPGQVAWVFDPHSDEEGCFGWVGGRIERLSRIAVVDHRGGERADESGKPEPSFKSTDNSDNVKESRNAPASSGSSDYSSLQRLVTNFFSYLTVLLLGFLLAWYIFPRVVVMTVPVDPQTGQPLSGSGLDSSARSADDHEPADGASENPRGGRSADHPSKTDGNGTKGDNAQPK